VSFQKKENVKYIDFINSNLQQSVFFIEKLIIFLCFAFGDAPSQIKNGSLEINCGKKVLSKPVDIFRSYYHRVLRLGIFGLFRNNFSTKI
jgi:hypothetical protein